MSSNRVAHLLLGVLVALSLGIEAARAAVPPQKTLDFAVVRNGKEIGSHVYNFQSEPEGFAVDVRIRIKYKLGFITVHRFKHDSHELWRGDRLISMSSATSEKNIIKGRAKHKVFVDATENDLDVRADMNSWQAPVGAIPGSLWNENALGHQILIDPVDGEKLTVNVESLGQEEITVNGRLLDAHHYRVTGDVERELWYDRESVLVRVKFTASDGSQIQYVLR